MPSIVFVDSRVANYQSLIDSLTEPADVFVLDGASDGLTQMVTYLQGRTGIDAIHVISHGSQGAMYLGSSVLDSGNLASRGSQLATIGSSLTETGDILLYGCNVAQGDVGLDFITSLAQYTGADVAASSDTTGAAALGGDWVFELQTGNTLPALSMQSYGGLLNAVNTAPTFTNSTGKAVLRVPSDFSVAESVAVDTNGKIIISCGFYIDGSLQLDLLRFNIDGSLDAGFGDSGLALSGLTGNDSAIGLQADGKIVALNTGNGGMLARFTTGGSLDTAFGTNGIVRAIANGSAESLAIQTDQKIIVAGSQSKIGGSDFWLARYNTDGALDATFGVDGSVNTNFNNGISVVKSVIALQSGKLLVVGTAQILGNSLFALARYGSTGILDSSFGTGGTVTTAFGGSNAGAFSAAIQPDGKVLVAGYSDTEYNNRTHIAVVRYNYDGTLDSTFGIEGKVLTKVVPGKNDYGYSVILQNDGKIIIAGNDTENLELVRYNSDGSLDNTFGGNGIVISNAAPISYPAIEQQSDGDILVVGGELKYQSGWVSNAFLARFNNDGTLDTTFGSPVNTLDVSPIFGERRAPVVIDSHVQILDSELAASGNYNGASLTLSRHNGANAQDVFSNSGGTLTTLAVNSYFAVDSVTIGRVTANDVGTLTLTFNANATQSLVNKAMQQIAYSNTSYAPPATVQIDWTFNDGNTGAQGTGGALSVTGSTTVQITATNDNPILAVPLVDQTLTANTAFSYTVPTGAFTDPDLETLTYSAVMADGTGMPPWVSFSAATRTFSGTPGTGDVGAFDIRVTAKDSANASVSDVVRLTVAAPDTSAPIASTFSPLDEATGIAISSNIVLTFNEAIAKGVGSIVLKTAAGVTVATYDAATSANLSVTGSTLTINPTSDLSNGTGYKVEFAAGTIKDLAGNSYAGTTSYNFTTVALVNSMPTGSVTITGTPTQGQTLTVSNTLADADGLGSISYQWQANGVNIAGATASSYTLTQTEVGKAITVKASYTDALRTPESKTSTATATVANINDLPTGAVTITGTATQGQTLTASNTLADVDGLGTISYQWYVFQDGGIGPDAVAIGTGSSYTLTQAEVGKAITVKASYTDALRTPESKTSAPTSTVATNQTSTGSTGNDSLTGSAGNDSIDGGAGTDAVVYSGSRSSFSLTKTSTGFTVVDSTGTNGTDTLLNVERLKFSDGAIALDVGATQPAGQTALLLGAVLPGRLVFDASKQIILGAVIDLFDQGYSLQTLSGAVMRLPIWDVLTGKAAPSNADIASYLLTNVNGAAPDATTLANAVTSLNAETSFATQGNFLWHLAESGANQTHVGLVGLGATGLAFA